LAEKDHELEQKIASRSTCGLAAGALEFLTCVFSQFALAQDALSSHGTHKVEAMKSDYSA
jgi:hypothetical protein